MIYLLANTISMPSPLNGFEIIPFVEVIEFLQAAASADFPSPSSGLLQPSFSSVAFGPAGPASGTSGLELAASYPQ
jgi:hypothetical protein